MKVIFFIFFYASIIFSSHAKKVGLNDLVEQLQKEKADIDLTIPKPFIDQVQLRLTDKNEFKKGDIDVEMRIETHNLKQFQLKRKLYKNQTQRGEIIGEYTYGQELKKIIGLYIAFQDQAKKLQQMKALRVLFVDKIKINKRLKRKGARSASQYVMVLKKYEDNEINIKQTQLRLQRIVGVLNQYLGSSYKVKDIKKNERLVSISEIRRTLAKQTEKSESIGLKLANLNYEKLELESGLKHENNHRILDFISLGTNQAYLPGSQEYDDSDQKDRRLEVRIGLRVPFLDSNMDRTENILENYSKKAKAKIERAESIDAIASLKEEINLLLFEIREQKRSKAFKEAKRQLAALGKRKSTPPLQLLDLHEFITNVKIQINQYQSSLTAKFLEYMFDIGKLSFEQGKLQIGD